MPRVEFDKYTDAEPYLNKIIKTSDKGFVGYFTKDGELIFIPSRSTQPILSVYIRKCSDKEAHSFGSSAHIDIFRISRFEFNSDRSLPVSETII